MSRAAHEERLMTIILGPHISEKSTAMADQNRQVVFKVRPDATKPEVKAAIEGDYATVGELWSAPGRDQARDSASGGAPVRGRGRQRHGRQYVR